MVEQSEIEERLHDFQRNPSYERRVVAFYDFLGWKSKIDEAGTDPEKIGKLRRTILQHVRALGGQQVHAAPNIRFSSFSDNVVVSQPVNPDDAVQLLGTLGSFQLGSLAEGFLMRGGVTVGWIHHDSVTVFGPSLNRAYELENKMANVPRIIVDPNVFEVIGSIPFFIKEENGVRFVDPFSVQFMRMLSALQDKSSMDVYSTLGFPRSGKRDLNSVPPDILLRFALQGIKPQLRMPLEDKEWNKVAWAYDRLAAELGVPPARSYPRVRPGDVV